MSSGEAKAPRKLLLTAQLDGADYGQCVRMARAADRALLHAVVVPERIGTAAGESGAASLEPFTLLSALSAATERIGLVAEVHAAYSEPYHIARKLAALDYLSGGRAGCSIAAGPAAAAQLYGRTGRSGRSPGCYGAAAVTEFAEALKRLWDSWEDDALIYDKQSGAQTASGKVRAIDYAGRYYAVKGPLNVARPPQGYPVVLCAATDEDGRRAAVREADVAVAALRSIGEAALWHADMRASLQRIGRSAGSCRLLAELHPVVAESRREAEELKRTMSQASGCGAAELPACAGTAVEVADRIEAWFRSGLVDGFHVVQPDTDQLERFAALVVPELQSRGLFRDRGEGEGDGMNSGTGTLRAGLGLERPNNRFAASRHRGGSI